MNRTLIESVQKLRKEGKSYGDIAKELLITKSNACYCCKINLDEYDEKKSSHQQYIDKVCELAKRCTNINQILTILGKKGTNEYYKQIKKILDENKIDTSHFVYDNQNELREYSPKRPIEEYLVSDSTISSTKLRNRLLKEGYKEYRCEKCGRTEWEGVSIPLQLHHINGNHDDNRLENLQMLCPNCHALTDTYCTKKNKKEHNHCVNCGKEISNCSKLCANCRREKDKISFRKDTYKSNDGTIRIRPSIEELLDAFKKFGSFSGVGRYFGVSDKAIVKWCSKYSLPISSLEMRKYIREYYNENFKWVFNEGNSEAFKQNL